LNKQLEFSRRPTSPSKNLETTKLIEHRNWSHSEKVLVYSTLQIVSLSDNLNVPAKRKDE
jgi:hypothetical protein